MKMLQIKKGRNVFRYALSSVRSYSVGFELNGDSLDDERRIVRVELIHEKPLSTDKAWVINNHDETTSLMFDVSDPVNDSVEIIDI